MSGKPPKFVPASRGNDRLERANSSLEAGQRSFVRRPDTRRRFGVSTETVTTTTPVLDIDGVLERHRGELRWYCERLLGSAADAEDAVQDTLVRGWRSIDRFEGRSSLRSWLYRIATNVCHDMRRGRLRHALPADVDELDLALEVDPADLVVEHEAVRRAFAVALGRLPVRQRTVVVLCDVLRWDAGEVGDLLGTTATAVHSLHQRARASLVRAAADRYDDSAVDEPTLARFVDAFERHDVSQLVTLLSDTAAVGLDGSGIASARRAGRPGCGRDLRSQHAAREATTR
jgi:RNA polymerase sigma factor (sigma-70 family)